MAFYQTHKLDFRHGEMKPIQNDLQFSTIMVSSPEKSFVSYGNYPALRVPIPDGAREIYLLNCSLADSLHTILQGLNGQYRAEVRDHTHAAMGESRVYAQPGGTLIDLAVPQGGLVALKRV
jgi:hypothetical protein